MSVERNNDAVGTTQSEQHPDYTLIMAPNPWHRRDNNLAPGLFLSGTIERDAADWRNVMACELRPYPVTIINPSRSDWDSTWREDINFEPYHQQVRWELDMMERADLAAVYFAPSTDAPVTLMELGLMVRKGSDNVKVCCTEGYKKRGNVQIVCEKYQLEMVDTASALVDAVQRRLQKW